MEIANLNSKRMNSDALGRYYTLDGASNALIRQLLHRKPQRVLDLGAGGGALTLAARKEWSDAEFVTVDIDLKSQQLIKSLMSASCKGRHMHYQFDALDFHLPDLLGGPNMKADVAICNPPFIKPQWKKEYEYILEDAGLSGCYATIKDASADVLFLAQNLRLMHDQGSLGIIVPDSIISGKKHEGLRRALIQRHQVDSVIKLPRNVFAGTDAQAHILTLTKSAPAAQKIELREIDGSGSLCAPIYVSQDEARFRLDFGFHSLLHSGGQSSRRLGELVVGIWRGNISSSARHNLPYSVFHITDFPSVEYAKDFSVPSCFFSGVGNNHPGAIVTQPGDILLARVGRNLEEKLCLVKKGSAIVTDCVYVIRPMEKFRHTVFESLSSVHGRQWLAQVAYGVSARQLPKCDLMNFPVNI